MKIAEIIVRSMLGLLFLFASVAFLFKLFPEPVLEGNMKIFNDGLAASGYLLHTVKAVELICGLMLVSGRFVALAAVLLAPITINIVGVHTFLDQKGLPVALFVLLANLFLAYYHRDKYKPLFSSK